MADVELLLPEPWQCETRMCPALYTAEQVRACVKARVERLEEACQWVLDNPGAHRNGVKAVILAALNHHRRTGECT